MTKITDSQLKYKKHLGEYVKILTSIAISDKYIKAYLYLLKLLNAPVSLSTYILFTGLTQEGQHPLTGQCAANFRWDLGAT